MACCIFTANISTVSGKFKAVLKLSANVKCYKELKKKKKRKDQLSTVKVITSDKNDKVQITLETENVSFTVHQFVCMPNCLCLLVVSRVTWATFAALTEN